MGNTQTIKWDPQFFLDLTHPTLGVGNLEKIPLSPKIYIKGFMGDIVVGSDKNLLNKK